MKPTNIRRLKENFSDFSNFCFKLSLTFSLHRCYSFCQLNKYFPTKQDALDSANNKISFVLKTDYIKRRLKLQETHYDQ